MTDTDGEITLANTISGIAVDLDFALIKALDCSTVEWITVGENLEIHVSNCLLQKHMGGTGHTPTTLALASSLA